MPKLFFSGAKKAFFWRKKAFIFTGRKRRPPLSPLFVFLPKAEKQKGVFLFCKSGQLCTKNGHVFIFNNAFWFDSQFVPIKAFV
ncbi:hypothetical protein SAMN05444266_104520 [Chitinophaga jiangningensis]|uniref:Uncharacterized protein n=1 Tax=Chitinophaga jiangningensis TaxID=1419482 RepID=A0A1M7CXN2_9BACT|nr:hypothetical protein [Chitinophaga jiangningensis]SHL72041.1 hypothetical protein SAMN05444266_104520 [Chitinophaga jiangningensis]